MPTPTAVAVYKSLKNKIGKYIEIPVSTGKELTNILDNLPNLFRYKIRR